MKSIAIIEDKKGASLILPRIGADVYQLARHIKGEKNDKRERERGV